MGGGKGREEPQFVASGRGGEGKEGKGRERRKDKKKNVNKLKKR